MALQLTPQQESFRDELRSWLARTKPPGYDDATYYELDYEQRFLIQRDWQRTLYDAGWLGISWPEEYGGRGLGRVEEAIYNQELGRVDTPGIANDVATVVAGPAILHHGTEKQRRRYLPPMLSADEIWCQGFSERDAGSDLAALSTSAVVDGESLVVNGAKIWTTLGFLADLGIMIVRTDPEVPRHRGLSAVIVDMRAPGIEVLPLVQINGDREFTEVLFHDVVVPRGNVIGEPGLGWKVAMTALAYERATRANAYKLDQVLRTLIDHTIGAERHLPSALENAARLELAQLWIEARAVRSWERRQFEREVAGAEIGAESSIGKVSSSELAQRMAEFAMTAFGPSGQAVNGDPLAIAGGVWPKLALTARYYTIASGTSEVQRNILSERVLGLPKG